MKVMSMSEMRNVDGGYRVKCLKCKKYKYYATKAGVSAFFVSHGITCGNKNVVWDTLYKNYNKWYG